jgi:hypothetical protein
MQVFRVAVLSVLLAAMAWGQAGVAPSGTAGSTVTGNQVPDPNQPPQSPLQEPTKPTEAQLNRPKAATFDVGDAAGTAQNQQLGEVRGMSRYTEVNGDRTRSFREPGLNDLGEFNYFADHEFSGNRRIQALGMFRSTDDPSVDPERNSLQKAYLRFYGPQDEYILGDALVNYSRLTFNQNIKGLVATWKLGPDWKLSAASGVFIDRWGSLYKDLLGRPYMAVVSGARVERKVMRDSAIGLNFSTSDDQVGTLPYAELGVAPLPASNRVASIDAKFLIKKLRLDAEYAYSFTDFDVRASNGLCLAGAPCDTRTQLPGFGMQGDWGGRLEGSYRHGKWGFRGSYLRYEPNFMASNARQISDLQDAMFRTSYELREWLTVEGTVRRSNDDLKHQKEALANGYETVMLAPEGRLLFHDLGFYRRAVFETGYRHRMVYSRNSKAVDRFVRSPYVELTLPYKTTFFSVGYERRLASDSGLPSGYPDITQDSNTNRYYVSLRGIYDLGGWHINPTMRWELERQSHRPGATPTVADYFLTYDSNRLGTAAIYVETPKYFILEVAFRDSSATISTPPGGTTAYWMPGGFSRPSYRAAVTYKIRNDENTLLIFSFERNSNFYYAQPHFDERVSGVTFVYKFGKRGR